jgi:hypothetical protein
MPLGQHQDSRARKEHKINFSCDSASTFAERGNRKVSFLSSETLAIRAQQRTIQCRGKILYWWWQDPYNLRSPQKKATLLVPADYTVQLTLLVSEATHEA